MSKPVRVLVYALMALTGLPAAYALLTNGDPDSLLRHVFPNPAADWYVAVVGSFLFFILGFIPFQTRQDAAYREVVERNAENIRLHRKKGKTDADIAASILSAMGVRAGYKYNMAHKKLLYYLSRFR